MVVMMMMMLVMSCAYKRWHERDEGELSSRAKEKSIQPGYGDDDASDVMYM